MIQNPKHNVVCLRRTEGAVRVWHPFAFSLETLEEHLFCRLQTFKLGRAACQLSRIIIYIIVACWLVYVVWIYNF